jgi:hypothetical protein
MWAMGMLIDTIWIVLAGQKIGSQAMSTTIG